MNSHEDWKAVGDTLEGLALKVKLHLEEAQSTASDDLERSIDGLGRAIDDAFGALRGATRDEALKEDLRRGGQQLSDALYNTFSEMGANVRRATKD